MIDAIEDHRRPSARIPGRLNLLIAALQLLAAGTIFALTGVADAWWHLALLALAFAVVGNSIYALMHEAEHRLFHPNRSVNEAAGVLLALFFPAPFHLLRQGHLHHHRRNRSDDEAFDFWFDGEIPLFKWLQLYGILTGLFWVAVVVSNVIVLCVPWALRRRHFAFDRPSAALVGALQPRYWRAIRLEALAACTLHTLIILGLGLSPLRYLLVYLGFGFTWSAMQYVHHFGTERDTRRGARNLWIWKPLDWIWLHHNWHLEHHLHPRTPWLHLPERAERSRATREFLPKHYLKMWRGPRRGERAVAPATTAGAGEETSRG
jgi:fatty acid desaturase